MALALNDLKIDKCFQYETIKRAIVGTYKAVVSLENWPNIKSDISKENQSMLELERVLIRGH